MPVITVHMLGSATREQKAQIVKEFTDTMVHVLGKDPSHTQVILTGVDSEDWGSGGILIADRNAAQAKG